MFEKQPQEIQQKVQFLADKYLRQSDPSGWFDVLYTEANNDAAQVPWARLAIHPHLQDWLNNHFFQSEGRCALVVGCGLGDDAEALQALGLKVTAFDISSTAIDWCKERFPHSQVDYLVADLFALPSEWSGAFDLVVESRNIQALPLNVRSQAINSIGKLVQKEAGTLLIITRFREHDIEPSGPPWAVSDKELAEFHKLDLKEMRRKAFLEGDNQEITKLWIEYRRQTNSSKTIH